MEGGWNVWVWIVGVVSRRRVWLVGVGGIYGCGWQEVGVDGLYECGCMEVYRFPQNITYPYILLLYLVFSALASLLFVHFKYAFRSCSSIFFVNYVKKFSGSINTHTGNYGRPTEAV